MSTRGQSIAALASEASGQRGKSIVRAPDTRPKPGSSARAADTRLFTDEPHQRLWWVAIGLLYLVLANLVAIAAFLAAAPPAYAGSPTAPGVPVFMTPGEMRSGALLLRSDNDRYVEPPLVGTDVDLVVSGPTARARVTQIFHNPTDGWVEAVYVYPLPEGGSVYTLKMRSEERRVGKECRSRLWTAT